MMTSLTEIGLMRNLPHGTTEAVLGALGREGRPLTLAELIDAGCGSRKNIEQALLLLNHRKDILIRTFGTAVIVKTYEVAP